MSLDRFKITWDKGAYYVSVPNYQGGEVVPIQAVDRLLAALKPFVELADVCDHFHNPDSHSVCKVAIGGIPHTGPTVGDCRAARNAYLAMSRLQNGGTRE